MANPVHALVVHFPVALLLVAPLFLCAGALMRPDRARVFALATLLLMILGTTGGWIAVATGKSAAEASAQGGAAGMIQHHEQLAETTSAVFTLLTPSYAAIVLLSFRQPQRGRMVTSVLPLAFLVVYLGGAILLAKTAHEGGRLHELGVAAPAVVHE
jgi:uncharacterized membrane protein